MIDQGIFRAYDIRGIVSESLTEDAVYQIAKAFGSDLAEQGIRQVFIARDGRMSGPALIKMLAKGLQDSGRDVVDVGRVPTPVLYFAASQSAEKTGVMLTGSHNPGNYNGLKMVMRGQSLTGEHIQGLYQRIKRQDFCQGSGQYVEQNVVPAYIEQLLAGVPLKRPLKVVIDAGNGVAGDIAPLLFERLGCEVKKIFCEIDGRFPNHHPDPSQPENLQDLIAAVKDNQADVGLAFDGDGDRLGVVTSKGEIIWPDRLLMLYAKALLTKTPQVKIIYDVKCTHHLEQVIRDAGGVPMMWKTGHSFIKAKMAEANAQLAGEMSGHFFFKDRWFGFDDALYAGARLLEVLAEDDRSSAEIFAGIPDSVNTPELKVFVKDAEKFSLMQKLVNAAVFETADNISDIDGLRVNFADGWGLIRPSNTTPYLVLRFEAGNENLLKEIQQRFRNWMLAVEPALELPF